MAPGSENWEGIPVKRIKIYPCPNVELRLHVSEQMEQDYKECAAKAESPGDGKDCNTCSWREVELENTCLCEWPVVCEKLIGG